LVVVLGKTLHAARKATYEISGVLDLGETAKCVSEEDIHGRVPRS